MEDTAKTASLWNSNFARRKTKTYATEDIPYLVKTKGDKELFISRFFRVRRSVKLAPPEEFSYPALRRLFKDADMDILGKTVPRSPLGEIVLLDERRDSPGDSTSTRVWDCPDNPGYLNYPVPGDVIHCGAMCLEELFQVLSGPVSCF